MRLDDRPTTAAKDPVIVGLLRSVHALELSGEAMFALMLEHGGPLSSDQRRKIEACRLLAVEMAERLYNHLRLDLGVPLAALPVAATSGAARAAIHGRTWSMRMAGLEIASAPAVAAFRELKARYGRRQEQLCNLLLAHALIMRDFAHHEAEGEPDSSLAGVVSLLGDEARQSLMVFQP